MVDEKQRCKEAKRDSKKTKKEKKRKRKHREMLEEENHKFDEVVDGRDDLIRTRTKNVMNGEGDSKLEVHSSCEDNEKVKKGKGKRNAETYRRETITNSKVNVILAETRLKSGERRGQKMKTCTVQTMRR